MIRIEVSKLVSLGRFPSSQSVSSAAITRQEQLLRAIVPPVTDEEARELVRLFGPDDYFGAAWTVVHLIETAPHWPLWDCLSDTSNEWIGRLKQRIANRSVSGTAPLSPP
jgi:hypothetical protein